MSGWNRTRPMPAGWPRGRRSILAWAALIAFATAFAALIADPNAMERDPYHTHAVVAANPKAAARALAEHRHPPRRNRGPAKASPDRPSRHDAAHHAHAPVATVRQRAADRADVPSAADTAAPGPIVVSMRGDDAAAAAKVSSGGGATSLPAHRDPQLVPPDRRSFSAGPVPFPIRSWDRSIPTPPPKVS